MRVTNASPRSNAATRAIGALSLVCALGLSCAPAAMAQTPYIQTATATNSFFDWTDLKKDLNHNTIYFFTSNWNPVGKTPTFNNHATGVYYDVRPNKGWSIFNQDLTGVPVGASFNVIGLQPAANIYVHQATAGTLAGDWTNLNNGFTNGNPNALVWAVPNWSAGVYENHNIGVWYTGANWAVFDQDGSAIPTNCDFNILIADGPFWPVAYVHTAGAGNIAGDTTYLDNPLINGTTGHMLMVTPNWSPPGGPNVYINHPIGVWYDSNVKRYGIFCEDSAGMPNGASFNVWVMK